MLTSWKPRPGTPGLRYGSRYFTAGDIDTLFTTVAIYIVPCANPDGRHFTQTSSDPMWRKNRNPGTALAARPAAGSISTNRSCGTTWRNSPRTPTFGTSDNPSIAKSTAAMAGLGARDAT